MSLLPILYTGEDSAGKQAKDAYRIRRILGGRATLYPNMTEEEVKELARSSDPSKILAALPQMSNAWIPDTYLVVDTHRRFNTIDEIFALEPKPPEKEEK